MGAVSEWTSYQNARLKSKGLGTKMFFGAAFVPTHIFWERCIGVQEGSVPKKYASFGRGSDGKWCERGFRVVKEDLGRVKE